MSGGGHSVVVTGLGPISSIGTGKDRFWQGLLSGAVGTRRLAEALFPRVRSRLAAPVADFDPTAYGIDEREARLLDPVTCYSIAGARLALEDAGFEVREREEGPRGHEVGGLDPERAGVIVGSGIGGLTTTERSHTAYAQGHPLTGAIRYALPMLIPNAPAAQVAIRFGFSGECKSVSTACAAGTMAIGDAFRLVRAGELDVAVAGGVEKTVGDHDGFGMIGFDLLRTLSMRNDEPERASRPFDVDRDGFVISEGAGLVVLERREHAEARGARIYAEVASYASTCDAHSMLALRPDGSQMVRVMKAAIRAAKGIRREDIVYANAHGTSTRLNDPTESRALHEVFGRHIRDVVVNSTKAMTGHAIAASGALEAIVTTLSLVGHRVHRCVNLDDPDPECDLNFARSNENVSPLAAITSSYGFGGHNASLVLRVP